LLSCDAKYLNSNDLSLSRGVEIILQDQEPCDVTPSLRSNKHIGLIPSAPLATQPAFLSKHQDMEQEAVYEHLPNMDDCLNIGDKFCITGALSHVIFPMLIHSFSHVDFPMTNLPSLPKYSHAFHGISMSSDYKHNFYAKVHECKT
jgi:hypothetical protein